MARKPKEVASVTIRGSYEKAATPRGLVGLSLRVWGRALTWDTVARKLAAKAGSLPVVLNNGGLRHYYRTEAGKVCYTTFGPEEWAWHGSEKAARLADGLPVFAK